MPRPKSPEICECGRPAVAYRTAYYTCQECIELDANIDWFDTARPRQQGTSPATTYSRNSPYYRPKVYELPHAYVHLATGGSFGYNYKRYWSN